MTKEQQQTIERLRNMGLGYWKIGIALDIPRDKVRNYCKAHGLDGYAKNVSKPEKERPGEKSVPTVCADNVAIY